MQRQPILAAVDLGSNSFRLQVARVEGNQLYMLDGLREPVRLAAGLTEDKFLTVEAQQQAFITLERFAERLRDLPPGAVRAVGTNSLRVAKNAADFLPQAEHVLGFPIEVIAGREEARLIYIGVAHGLPQSDDNRLVIDIGGGSTEFIIGKGLTPIKLESLYMGCVSFTSRFFADGKVSKQNLKQAELAARNELQTIISDYRGQWQQAIGSSGTAKALAEILELNGYSKSGITREGLETLRTQLLEAGDVNKLSLQGLRPDRAQVIAGGLAIMYAAFCELDIQQMTPALGALREGVLYDLLGRFHDDDMRNVTVAQFMQRYHVDAAQATRVGKLAHSIAQQFLGDEIDLNLIDWAASLHEIGISVAHSGYHRHTAYILANADMPGFSKKVQAQLSMLTLAQRGSLAKLKERRKDAKVPAKSIEMKATQEARIIGGFGTDMDLATDYALVMSMRLAVLFHRSRSDIALPNLHCHFSGTKFHIKLEQDWLTQNPLTEAALQDEIKQWKALEIGVQIEGL